MFRASSNQKNTPNNNQEPLRFIIYLTGVSYRDGECLLNICHFNPYVLERKTNLKGYPIDIFIESFFEIEHWGLEKNDIYEKAKKIKPDAIVYVINRHSTINKTQIKKIKMLATLDVPILLVGTHCRGKVATTKEVLEKFAYENNLSRPFFSEDEDVQTVFDRAATLALNRILYKRTAYIPHKCACRPTPQNVDETIAFRFEALKEAILRFLKEQIELSKDDDKKRTYDFFARRLSGNNNQLLLDYLINDIKDFLKWQLFNLQGFSKQNYLVNWKSYFQFKKIKSIANEIYPSILEKQNKNFALIQNEDNQKSFIKGASIGFLGLFGIPKEVSSQEFAKYLTRTDAYNLALVSKTIATTADKHQNISMKK